jgi:hypothetical protein
LTLTLAAPAIGQTVYRCPGSSGPIYQQAPCPAGQQVVVRPIPAGAGAGLSEAGRAYLTERETYWAERAAAQKAEQARQEALAVERHKANAAYEQAAAQRATARAIWALGFGR